MKLFVTLLLIAMVAIAMEKCAGEYLLVEVEDEPVPTPRECCEDSNIPEFCLGLCSPADAMARREKRVTACSQHEAIIEKCFQASEGGLKGNIDSRSFRDYIPNVKAGVKKTVEKVWDVIGKLG